MALDIVGKLHKVFEVEQKTDSFKTREFVIETSGEYPQFVKFQTTQDRCSMIEAYKEGDQLKVHFDLRGREWQGKYFTNLNAWKVEAASDAAPSREENYSSTSSNGASNNASSSDMPMDAREDLDDLPF